jgi:hypothetical protein
MNAALAQVDLALVKTFVDRGVDEAMAVVLAQGDAVLDNGLDGAGVKLSELARSIAVDTLKWLGGTSLDQSRVQTQQITNLGPTKIGELGAAGIFEEYVDGTRVRITSRSIARRRIALAILSHPVSGPRLKIRQPSARFKRRPRERTEAELEGLRRGNEQRAEAARQRREARTAARV